MSDKKTSSDLITGSLIGGAVGIAAAGFWYFLSKKEKENADLSAPSSLQRSASITTKELLHEVRMLREALSNKEQENSRLMRQLRLHESSEIDSEAKINTGVTPSEIETIKAVFDLFDTNNSGAIYTKEMQQLHAKLGEPLTDEEVEVVIRDMDSKQKGEVDFQDFLGWWIRNHKYKRDSDAYTSRFKLLNAKITEQSFDISRIVVKHVGRPGTREYRVVFNYKEKNNMLRKISPWHDIPLFSVGTNTLDAKIFHFICEIPKWTRAKFEIATGEAYNPIKQDVKNGKLRYYKYGDMLFNYGCFPRTWEDPKHIPSDTGCPGDNDPIDAIEIGTRQLSTGSVTAVKILGVLALIDSGETDWKVICISINDPLAHLLNDIDDVDAHIPGATNAIREYLRLYKVWSGTEENSYAHHGEALNRDYAIRVVEECHNQWKELANSQQKTI